MSYVCLNCKARDEAVEKPLRCARCCYWGRMLDTRLLQLRERDARRRGRLAVGDGDESIIEDDLDIDRDDDDDEEVAEEIRLSDVRGVTDYERAKTHITPFDSIIGGGMAFGFVYGLAGDPGAGKSTLSLQIARGLRLETRYATAEEHIDDITIRAKRAKIPTRNIVVVTTTDITQALPYEDDRDGDDNDQNDADQDDGFAPPQRDFDLVIIDSVQKYRHPDYAGRPGGNEQIVRVIGYIAKATKALGCITIALSRVNAEGRVAGPNDFTHDVDCMMWLKFAGFDKDGNPDENCPGRAITIPRKNRGASTPQRIECTMADKGLVFS